MTNVAETIFEILPKNQKIIYNFLGRREREHLLIENRLESYLEIKDLKNRKFFTEKKEGKYLKFSKNCKLKHTKNSLNIQIKIRKKLKKMKYFYNSIKKSEIKKPMAPHNTSQYLIANYIEGRDANNSEPIFSNDFTNENLSNEYTDYDLDALCITGGSMRGNINFLPLLDSEFFEKDRLSVTSTNASITNDEEEDKEIKIQNEEKLQSLITKLSQNLQFF